MSQPQSHTPPNIYSVPSFFSADDTATDPTDPHFSSVNLATSFLSSTSAPPPPTSPPPNSHGEFNQPLALRQFSSRQFRGRRQYGTFGPSTVPAPDAKTEPSFTSAPLYSHSDSPFKPHALTSLSAGGSSTKPRSQVSESFQVKPDLPAQAPPYRSALLDPSISGGTLSSAGSARGNQGDEQDLSPRTSSPRSTVSPQLSRPPPTLPTTTSSTGTSRGPSTVSDGGTNHQQPKQSPFGKSESQTSDFVETVPPTQLQLDSLPASTLAEGAVLPEEESFTAPYLVPKQTPSASESDALASPNQESGVSPQLYKAELEPEIPPPVGTDPSQTSQPAPENHKPDTIQSDFGGHQLENSAVPPSGLPREITSEELHTLSKLEDIETCSTLSIQQLTESLQNEPPDFHSIADDLLPTDTFDKDRTPTPGGSREQPFSLPLPKSTALSKYAPRPQPYQYASLPSMASMKMPSHVQAAPQPTQKNSVDFSGSEKSFSPLPTKEGSPKFEHPQPSSRGSEPMKIPLHFQPEKFHVATSRESPEKLKSRKKSMERQLTEALQAKANLAGQLESVVEECKATLKDRAELQLKLARTEAELAETVERVASQLGPEMGRGRVEKDWEVGQLKRTESALEREQKASSSLKDELAREKHQARRVQNELAKAQQNLTAQEEAVSDLREKLGSLQAEVDKKGGENEELDCKLSSLQASYEALQGTKSWLHGQLQDALESKMKLQEELRESKASTIAQSIKIDQLGRENVTFQQQIGELQKGVLQDKARLVSELEAIEADVLLREGSYTQLVAERAQLEGLVRMKGGDIERLNSELAKAHVDREELAQQLQEVRKQNDILALHEENAGEAKKALERKLRSAEEELESKESDTRELEKLKSALQERLRQSEAALISKEGRLQGLKDAKEITKHELEMVKEARETTETELNEARKEVAQLEGELKSALNDAREKDAKIRALSQAQQANAAENQILHSQMAERERELGQKSEELSSLETQSQDLMTHFKSLQDQFQSIAAERGLVHDSIAEKDRIIAHLAAEKDKLEEELGSVREGKDRLQSRVAQLQQEKARLQGELAASSETASLEEVQKTLQEKAALQSELNSLRVGHQHEMIKAQAKINRLELDLKAARKETSKAEKQLQKALQAEEEELSELASMKSQFGTSLQEVSGKLAQAVQAKAAAEKALKPLKEQIANLQARNDHLGKQNQEVAEQLQQEAIQRVDVERASGMVALRLKQNAEERESQLQDQIRDLSLEVERLRGRLSGINATQIAMRDHTGALEANLAQRESSLVKLSSQAQQVLQEKEREDRAFMEQISLLEQQLETAQRKVDASREEARSEKQRADSLEQDLAQRESELAMKAAAGELRSLEDKFTRLSEDRDKLQAEAGSLKSQLVAARTSTESAERDLSDKNSQVEILQQELKMAKEQGRQAEEEMKQLQVHFRSAEERHKAEMDSLRQALSDAARGGVKSGVLDSTLSSLSLDETDHLSLPSDISSSAQSPEDPLKREVEKVERLNDTLRQSSQQTISQLLGYNSLYRAHLREMGSRLEQARRQGQEAAELKKSGEISVLREELGSKFKTISGLQSCLLSLKEDMSKLQHQMDHHSADASASYQSFRQIESQIEDLRRSSSMHSPLFLPTPTEHSQ